MADHRVLGNAWPEPPRSVVGSLTNWTVPTLPLLRYDLPVVLPHENRLLSFREETGAARHKSIDGGVEEQGPEAKGGKRCRREEPEIHLRTKKTVVSFDLLYGEPP